MGPHRVSPLCPLWNILKCELTSTEILISVALIESNDGTSGRVIASSELFHIKNSGAGPILHKHGVSPNINSLKPGRG